MADHYRSSMTEDDLKAIFAALVDLQDQKMTPAKSRQVVGEKFSIPYFLVAEIEAEGMAKEWPPLGDG
jgi:hypothetical protein